MLKKQYFILCKEADLSAQGSRVLTDIFHYVQLHPILFSTPSSPHRTIPMDAVHKYRIAVDS